MMTTSRCASCGETILYALTTSTNKRIPINPTPVPDGNIELDPRNGISLPYAKTWGTSHQWPEGVDRFISHFVTCPAAASFRKKTR